MFERNYTDFLTADGSLLLGAASAFDLSGHFFQYNRSATRELADARAIRQDFLMIGQDVTDVAEKLKGQQKKQQQLPLGL